MTAHQTIEIADFDAVTLTKHYASGELSPVEATTAALERIERYNAQVNAYCYVDAEGALASARRSEARWRQGQPLSPIDGIPSSIKDLTMVEGMPTRMGSLTSTAELSTQSAPFSARMEEAGAVLLGKTTTPEFGWKGVTDSRLTGITRNPWDLSRTAGGSSGGAAAAAALNMGVLHQGSDAGGSIRIPGAFCGIFGLKPTFGYIPQWPASAMGTLSHLGPMTRTVEDSLLMLNAVAHPDARDWYSDRRWNGCGLEASDTLLNGVRIAYSPTLGYVKVDPGVRQRVELAVKQLSQLGAEVSELDPGFEDPIDVFSTLWFAGAGKVVSQLDETARARLDPGFLEIGLQGQRIDIVDYMKALDRRAELGVLMNRFHARYDLLVTPTVPITAFQAGSNTATQDQAHWMEWTPFSYPFNLTQQPAATVPCGLVDGLPVGLQVVGARGADLNVLHVCRAFARAKPEPFLDRPRVK